MDDTTYTVVKGDTLSKIAADNNTTVAKLKELNDLDSDKIVIGQVLKLSGTASTKTTNTTNKPIIKLFGIQSETERTMFVTWSWDKKNTEEYKVVWRYATGDGVAFIGNETTEKYKQSTYTAPDNATSVSVVIKPIAKTHKVDKKDVAYWTASWSTKKTFKMSNADPLVPNVPTVTMNKYVLTAELNNIDDKINATHIQFQIIVNDKKVYEYGECAIIRNYVSYTATLTPGNRYKIRCRAKRNKVYGDWSDYSDNIEMCPSTPPKITKYCALSSTSVFIDWEASDNASSYTVEYTTKKPYFDSSPDNVQSASIENVTHAEITGLETGQIYYFRVQAVNSSGESGWTDIVSVTIGEKPDPPTSWSSTTTVIMGEQLVLWWTHNSKDNSTATKAQMQITYGKVRRIIDFEESKTNYSYEIDTNECVEGETVMWSVRTAGITGEWSDWAAQRNVQVYAKPSMTLLLLKDDGTEIQYLTEFPMNVVGDTYPKSQKPLSYHVDVYSLSDYSSVDEVGNVKIVTTNSPVFSEDYNLNDALRLVLSADNIDLENNIHYRVDAIASLDSGLTASSSAEFGVYWSDDHYDPNAEVIINFTERTAYIRPFCEDENGNLIDNVKLSVYRRDFDGKYILLGENIKNTSMTYITDPHPSLDYARYRIIARSDDTGSISWYDLPAIPIGETSVIIQWDEQWHEFDAPTTEDEISEPSWAGSLLELPYNIDVSDNYDGDSSLVEYIGREHPVGYYGTQKGHTSTWNVDVPISDTETLFQLRRLANWLGNVYVREPNGSGYNARVTVSFSRTHCEVVMPVTLNVVRVEGGV